MKQSKRVFKVNDHQSLSTINEILTELEVMHFRFKSAIDYLESKTINASDEVIEMRKYIIDFYKELLDQIELHRLNL